MKKTEKPLYKRIYSSLAREIAQNKYAKWGILPSEHTLCGRFNASRGTVRQSLCLLKNDGLVRAIHGKGWEVMSQNSTNFLLEGKEIAYLSRTDAASALLAKTMREKFTYNKIRLDVFFQSNIYDKYNCINNRNIKSENYAQNIQKDIPNKDVLVHSIEYLKGYSEQCFSSKKIGGAVVFSDCEIPEHYFGFLSTHQIPLVCVGLQEHCKYDTVVTDNLMGAEMLTSHLIELGHKSILFAGGGSLDRNIPSFTFRRIGYEKAMRTNNLQVETLLIEPHNWLMTGHETCLFEKLKNLEASKRKLTCIFCATDRTAAEMIVLLNRHGYKIPEDISIAGFGGGLTGNECDMSGFKSITTVLEDWKAVGEMAAEIIIANIMKKNHQSHLTLIKPKLIGHVDSVRDLTVI